jgi:hypothetical protein
LSWFSVISYRRQFVANYFFALNPSNSISTTKTEKIVILATRSQIRETARNHIWIVRTKERLVPFLKFHDEYHMCAEKRVLLRFNEYTWDGILSNKTKKQHFKLVEN